MQYTLKLVGVSIPCNLICESDHKTPYTCAKVSMCAVRSVEKLVNFGN